MQNADGMKLISAENRLLNFSRLVWAPYQISDWYGVIPAIPFPAPLGLYQVWVSSLLTSLFLISHILLCFETRNVHNAIVVNTETIFRILSPVKVAGACHYGWARC